MKKKFTVVLFSFTFIAFITFHSYRLQSNTVQPPTPGLAGDPGQTTCNHCHSGITTTDASRFTLKLSPDTVGLVGSSHIVTTGTQYIPDSVQWLSLTLHGSAVLYGFQLTAVNASMGRADSFLLVNTANTSKERSSTRSYVGHRAANGNTTWSFKWKAPHSGTVSFYYTGNFADGDGSNNGDSVYQSMATVAAMPLGIDEVSADITAVSVFPIPAAASVTTALQLSQSSSLTITLIDIQGKTVKQLYSAIAPQGLFTQSYDISDMPTGLYLLKMETSNGLVVRRVVKK